MDQTNMYTEASSSGDKKNTGDNSSEDDMNWGSPISRPVESIALSSSLDFLDEDDVKSDEDTFPILASRAPAQMHCSAEISTVDRPDLATHTGSDEEVFPIKTSSVNHHGSDGPSAPATAVKPQECTEDEVCASIPDSKVAKQSFTDFLSSESEEFDVLPRQQNVSAHGPPLPTSDTTGRVIHQQDTTGGVLPTSSDTTVPHQLDTTVLHQEDPLQSHTASHPHIPDQSHETSHTSGHVDPFASTPAKITRLGPSPTTKFENSSLIKFAGDVLLKYSKVSSKRVFRNSIVDRPVWILESYRPVLPIISEGTIRDMTALEIADTPIRSVEKDYSKIKSLLRLRDDVIFKHDLVLSIGAESLNGMISDGNILFGSPEEIFGHIAAQSSFTPLETNVLRYKMGLSCTFKGVELSPHLLRQVLAINIPELTSAFIRQQKNRITYLVLFYKLGIVDGRGWEPLYSKNLFYRFLLGRAGISSGQVMKEGRGGWNVRSIVDFGISKILNVDRPKQQTSPLENLQASRPETTYGARNSSVSTLDALYIPNGVSTVADTPADDISDVADTLSNDISPPNDITRADDTQRPTPGESRKSIFDESDDDDLFVGTDQPKELPVTGQSIIAGVSPSTNSPSAVATVDNTADSATTTVTLGSAVAMVDNTVSDKLSTADHATDAMAEDSKADHTADDLPKGGPNQLYNKKFSKSFADIFTLEGEATAPEKVDLSSYVPDVSETDRPIFAADDTESKGSVISNLLGIFKKKPVEPKKAKDDIMQARLSRPLKAEIQAPEKRERKVIQSSYANMKDAESVDIPGFRPVKK